MAALNTPYAVLSFAHLFTPRPRAEGQDPVYSCSLIFDPVAQKSKEFKALEAACIAAAKEKFGDKVNVSGLQMPFRDAGEKSDKYEGYNEGDVYISPWSKQKPGIVNTRLQDVLLPDEVYAGQVVRANVNPFAWSKSGKRGVSLGLNHIQIVKANAPRIDGRAPANKAFDALESDEADDTDDIPF